MNNENHEQPPSNETQNVNYDKFIKKMILQDLHSQNMRYGYGSDHSQKDGAMNYVKERLQRKYEKSRKKSRIGRVQRRRQQD